MKFTAGLYSPSYPAVWLLFGLIFAQATAHFLSLTWTKAATITVYAVPLVWCALIAYTQFKVLKKPNLIDVLFLAFIFVILVSTSFVSGLDDENGVVWKYIRFMPFMMITPYVLGRLMRLPDLDLFFRITLLAGLALMPLLLLDLLTTEGRAWRWPIFGLDHGPLLVGVLLAALLLSLCVLVLAKTTPGVREGHNRQLIFLVLIGLVTVLMAWLKARGWLIAGLTGVGIAVLFTRNRRPAVRAGLFAYVVVVAVLSIVLLNSSHIYALLLTTPAPTTTPELCPILGEVSCQPFRAGINSVAMRLVLYREAVAMFMDKPVWGVGATRFGDCSCSGLGWYPHSTILQTFSELGSIGGGLLLALFFFSTVTLVKPFVSAKSGEIRPVHVFALALFATFVMADQFYGTYFMSAGTWLMLGVAASISMHSKTGRE